VISAFSNFLGVTMIFLKCSASATGISVMILLLIDLSANTSCKRNGYSIEMSKITILVFFYGRRPVILSSIVKKPVMTVLISSSRNSRMAPVKPTDKSPRPVRSGLRMLLCGGMGHGRHAGWSIPPVFYGRAISSISQVLTSA
jgi:hypothetical protein